MQWELFNSFFKITQTTQNMPNPWRSVRVSSVLDEVYTNWPRFLGFYFKKRWGSILKQKEEETLLTKIYSKFISVFWEIGYNQTKPSKMRKANVEEVSITPWKPVLPIEKLLSMGTVACAAPLAGNHGAGSARAKGGRGSLRTGPVFVLTFCVPLFTAYFSHILGAQ